MSWKDKIKNPFRNKNDKEKQINKENSMAKTSTYGNAEKIDYIKVQQAFNKTKGNKKSHTITSLKDKLKNFSKKFEELSKDKKEEELRSEKFQQLSKDINSLKNSELSKIIESMENQRELSEYEQLSKQIEELADKLDTIEKENLKVQGSNIDDIAYSTENISKVINESFWNKLKQSIPIPKFDLTPITQKIDSIKSDLNNSNIKLSKKIDNIKFPTPQQIPNDILKKDDFEFTINDKLKDLQEIKESSENLETVPAKVNLIEKELKNLSEKMDNLPSSNASQSAKYIPKEEKSVIELARYMTDGVAQLENIAKEYISKISELDKLDKIKEKHQHELEQAKRGEFKNGKKAGKIELIKTLAENFPTEFKNIQSTFGDLLEEKFKKDEILEIKDDNLNEMLPFIEDKIENGKYMVLSPAILIDGEILFKANIKAKEDSKTIDSLEKADE